MNDSIQGIRLLVCGGRDFNVPSFVYQHLDNLHFNTPIGLIIHGNARGPDRFAKYWAERRGIPNLSFEPDWENIDVPGAVVKYRRDGTAYNAVAGLWRNTEMLEQGKPQVAMVFPGKTGTADMRRKAIAAGIRVIEPRWNERFLV